VKVAYFRKTVEIDSVKFIVFSSGFIEGCVCFCRVAYLISISSLETADHNNFEQ
jgi:hypothetical protein